MRTSNLVVEFLTFVPSIKTAVPRALISALSWRIAAHGPIAEIAGNCTSGIARWSLWRTSERSSSPAAVSLPGNLPGKSFAKSETRGNSDHRLIYTPAYPATPRNDRETIDRAALCSHAEAQKVYYSLYLYLSRLFLRLAFRIFATFSPQYSCRERERDRGASCLVYSPRCYTSVPFISATGFTLRSVNKRQLCNITNCRGSLFAFPVD